jgi:phage nucleotide-binding protein
VTDVLRPGNLGGLQILKAAKQAPNINMLIYGDPGVGKTRLAGSADAVPELRPVLFVDVEGGTLTLRDVYPDCDVVRVTNWPELQAIYDELRAGLHSYRTVVIDSLTELQQFNMEQLILNKSAEDPDTDEDIATLRDWQRSGTQVRKFIRAYRDLPITTIFTALLKNDKDKLSSKVSKKPSLPGKMADQVAGMFDLVAYMYKKSIETSDGVEERRLLLTAATETITAKDRSGKLPTVMPEPTMLDMYNIMIKGVKK